MSFTSVRERALWACAALVAAAIFGSILPGASVATALRVRGLLGPTTATFLCLVAAGVVVATARPPARWRTWSVLAAAGAITALWVPRLENLSERVHIVEYAALALLVEGAVRERRRATGSLDPLALATAAAMTASLGGIDEGVQGLVPDRVCDLNDVLLDTTAGGLALFVGLAYRAARARDARS